MDEDLARLRAVRDAESFVGVLEQNIEASLTHDFWEITLANDLATSSARAPALFAYYATLNLVNAPVLFSDLRVPELFDPALRANRAALERHHLFPVGYLKRAGIDEVRMINQIANYALLEWGVNGEITDRAPSDYYPEFENRVSPEMARLHALPLGWERMPYEEFLQKRRLLMARVIREGFERLSSEPAEEQWAVAAGGLVTEGAS